LITVNHISGKKVVTRQGMVSPGTLRLVDRADVAQEIWRAICDLFFSAENQSRFMGTAEEVGLTPPMLKALLELDPDEAKPMRALADDWGCDASFVTVVVDGLEHRGYARRLVATHDRRVKTVELTDQGRAVRAQAEEAVYGARSGFWELESDEQVTLARLLRKLADAQAGYDESVRREHGARFWGRNVAAPRRGPQPAVARGGGRGRGREASGAAHGHGHGWAAGGEPEARTGPDVEVGVDPAVAGRLAGAAAAAVAATAAAARGGNGGDEPADGPDGWRAHLAAHRDELRRVHDELARLRDEVAAQARRPFDEARAEVKAAKASAKGRARRPVDELKAAKAEVVGELRAARDDITAEARAAAGDVGRAMRGKGPGNPPGEARPRR